MVNKLNYPELKDLTNLQIENIHSSIIEINNKMSLPPKEKIRLKLKPYNIFRHWTGYDCGIDCRKELLNYLKYINVVKEFKFYVHKYQNEIGYEDKVDVIVDLDKLKNFDSVIKKEHDYRINNNKKKIKKDVSKISDVSNVTMYEISFLLSNEILLNNIYLIGKPNLNSENCAVFTYLMEHPYKKIKKKEIEEHIGYKIGKSLHKIVENLGFTNELRKMFFTVSETVILFRNPISKSEFDKLNLHPLRFSKK